MDSSTSHDTLPPEEAAADVASLVRRRELDDQEASNTASAWRHGRRAGVAVLLAAIFGSYAGEVGPQAYSIAMALIAWGGLSATRVVKALRRIRGARRERDLLPFVSPPVPDPVREA